MISDEDAEAAALVAGHVAARKRAVEAGRRIATMEELAALLHRVDGEVARTCSLKGVVGQAANALIARARNGSCTADDVREVFAAILKKPVVEWDVLRPVLGASSETHTFLEFGATRVWNAPALAAHLDEEYPGDEVSSLLPVKDGLVAHVTAPARDARAALAVGDVRLVEFESILRYIGGTKHRDLGVFTHQPPSHRMHAVVSMLGTLHGGGVEGALLPFDLDDERLLDDDYVGAADVWSIHAKQERSRVEDKLVMGVHWLSRAKRERDPALSVAQCCFGLEAVLPRSGHGPLHAFVADLLATGPENRDHFEARSREMFSARNKVAHGDVVALDPAAREAAIQLASGVYRRLLVEDLRGAPTETAFAQAIRARGTMSRDVASGART